MAAADNLSLASLRLREHGAQLFTRTIDRHGLEAFERALAGLPPGHAGIRLHGIQALRPFLSAESRAGAIAKAILGAGSQPVRAILFDKSPANNWSLAWHQDRTIAVAERRDAAGFGPWTLKAGHHHVEPPIALLETMVTIRIHLDRVLEDNAPLLVAPGSHRLGRVLEAEIGGVVQRCGVVSCPAEAGDVWCYATPILHASEAAKEPSRRRVLQVDYSAQVLPAGLKWLGI